MEKNVLFLVVPCYNEEEILRDSAQILKIKLQNLIALNKISKNSKIMFVDDGSLDNTWPIILELHNKIPLFTGIKLSKNEGHQNALLAGLLTAKNFSDFTISLDADLQDDVNAIDEMVNKFLEGYEIVYGVRNCRKTDSFFKKTTANLFYKTMNFLGAKTIDNHADFRLMSKKAIIALEKFKEVNIFLRGIIPLIGYRSTNVFYKREKRKAGVSKYPLKKMLYFAMDGITSCSVKLIHFILIAGVVSTLLSITGMLTLGLLNIFQFSFIKMSTTANLIIFLILTAWLIGGLNLIATAIIGEYVGKTYLETKHRPKFIIETNLEEKTQKTDENDF